ncbi:MAG: response regulator transcription factor [Verrucomicrobia bacterium]|nr:response regulator transcription factor [Verrucomicrobiota bacterium]
MTHPPPVANSGVPPRRVFLVDDHPLVREWLSALINQQPDLEVCGEADGAPGALAAIAELRPDAAVVDLTLRKGSGIELIKDLRRLRPELAIVVLSMHDEPFYAERSLRAGARGYVVKREATKKVLAALRAALTGAIYVNEEFAAALLARNLGRSGASAGAERSSVEVLSDRELEVFRLLGQGQTTASIADTLSISLKTVQAYCARVKEKLGLANANELLRAAVRWLEGNAPPGR